ncbi:MAG: translation initiation factor IF-6 [Candidatus Bathyarchaeia archaeon]
MPIAYFNLAGDPNIGVFILATDRFVIAPRLLSQRKTERLAEALRLSRWTRVRLCGSKLLGVFASANSRGVVLPDLCSEDEVEELKASLGVEVQAVSTKWTALGNCILANDLGGVVDRRIPQAAIQTIEKTLGIRLTPSTIAGLPHVGSLGVATNKGVLVHPKATEDEKRQLERALKVPVGVGTVNGGAVYVKLGLVANSYGAAVGAGTTGLELATITSTLGIQ